MSFRAYIVFMFIASLIAWSAWSVIIFLVNPYEADLLSFFLFYLSLFFSLLGTFTIVESLIRKIFIKDKILFRQVIISFRQATFISLLIIICLYLQSERLLTWWNILFLISLTSIMELFSISKKQRI